MIAYHIDRAASLRAGQDIYCHTQDMYEGFQREYIQKLFGCGGVSEFGKVYTSFSDDSIGKPIKWFHETIFEYVRQLWYPSCPSRFQGFFAVPSIADIAPWMKRLKSSKDTPIWEVDVQEGILVDATWRDAEHYFNGQTLLDPAFSTINAVNYWEGKESPEPFWELLCPLPVKVLGRIVV